MLSTVPPTTRDPRLVTNTSTCLSLPIHKMGVSIKKGRLKLKPQYKVLHRTATCIPQHGRETELWTSFSRELYTYDFLDLPARLFSPVRIHGDRVLLFLTLGRVRIQTPVFWLPIPFPNEMCHNTARMHAGASSCLTRLPPTEPI